MVGNSETILVPCGSSSDVGGYLAVKSANRKLTRYPTLQPPRLAPIPLLAARIHIRLVQSEIALIPYV